MDTQVRSTDAKGRVSLPKGFSNSTVIIECISDTEVRIRKAIVIPEDEVRFTEESTHPLSDRDRDRFLEFLDQAPAPNEALKSAIARHAKPHG
jgi:hypothetical protein